MYGGLRHDVDGESCCLLLCQFPWKSRLRVLINYRHAVRRCGHQRCNQRWHKASSSSVQGRRLYLQVAGHIALVQGRDTLKSRHLLQSGRPDLLKISFKYRCLHTSFGLRLSPNACHANLSRRCRVKPHSGSAFSCTLCIVRHCSIYHHADIQYSMQ